MPITLYSWRRKHPHTDRWRVLRWKMTDEDARRWAETEGAEIEKVPGSEEVRTEVPGHGAMFFHATARGRSTNTSANLSKNRGTSRQDRQTLTTAAGERDSWGAFAVARSVARPAPGV